MKKIKIVMLLILSSLVFFACKDDEIVKINNDAASGKISFVLNKPAYSNYVLENANASSTMDSITCVQPNYGFTSAVTYTTQVSLGSTFAEGTYSELATKGTTGEIVGINTKEMNKALIAFNGGAFSEPLLYKTVYVRLKAVIGSATISATNDSLQVKPLYSNVISLKIKPYIEPLDYYYNVTLRPWYIVGLGGKWDNSVAGLGSSLIPLGVINGKSYDPGTGDGTFATTVYIKSSDSFKLIRDVSAWSPSWAMTGGALKYNGNDNITVAADGWYTLTLNSIDNKLTIAATTAPTSNYAKIGLVGDFDNWGGNNEEFFTANTNAGGHLWYTTYTFAADNASDGGCKFRANSAWTDDWGAPSPDHCDDRYRLAGIGGYKGKNISFKKGSYTIIFNDIDGSYYFIKK